MRSIALLALASSAIAAPAAAAPPGAFDAIAFFSGATEGRGSLKVMMHGAHPMAVHGMGQVGRDGTLVLHQTVERAGRPPKDREWRIRQVAPGRYAGTLSDADGPIVGETFGNQLHLRFRMKGGLAAEQWLTLGTDGRTAHNIMWVRKLGVVVARLDETIYRVGD